MFDRRQLTVIAQAGQMIGAVVLGIVVMGDDPNRMAIVLTVLAIGICNALNAPAWTALVPSLVPREHLPGAVSLNSTQMNASRVVGPAIAGVLFPVIGAAGVFFINAGTYIFAIGTLLAITAPPPPARDDSTPTGLRRLASGVAVMRRDPLVRRIIVGLFVFSLLCLPFIGQMPTIAEENLGLDVESMAYGLLYACFGLGAVTGAVSIGTFLSGVSRRTVVLRGLAGFALSLGAFGLLRSPVPAYVVVALLGFSYFATVTALNTILQVHLADNMRGRVMSLWLMAFGGTVTLGLMIAGPIAEALSITFVLEYGAIVGVALFLYVRFIVPVATAEPVTD
jgi:MFS family permease